MNKFRKVMSWTLLAMMVSVLAAAASAQEQTDKQKEQIEKKQRVERQYSERRAEGKKRFHSHKRHSAGIRGLSRLELTEDQLQQIKTLSETQRLARAPQMEELREMMKKKREGTFTEADAARVEDIKANMKASADQHRSSVLAILTPEQLQKFQEMQEAKRQRLEERKKRMEERIQRMREKKQSKDTADQPGI